jgi:hypothetical protein
MDIFRVRLAWISHRFVGACLCARPGGGFAGLGAACRPPYVRGTPSAQLSVLKLAAKFIQKVLPCEDFRPEVAAAVQPPQQNVQSFP